MSEEQGELTSLSASFDHVPVARDDAVKVPRRHLLGLLRHLTTGRQRVSESERMGSEARAYTLSLPMAYHNMRL